ncbi:MAG TPA: S8 family serine peptidase, partial [Candidatus Limnocylindrales bacterium]|nr:S8 family serine peptidase [Candidatus Limnocylindrales bacterium]
MPAERRVGRALRLVVWLQISLLIFSLVAPIGAIAADPSDPPPTEEPSSPPSAEPSPEPSAEPTAEPTALPDPTPEPTPDPTPDPTPAPSAAPTSPFIVTFASNVSAGDQAAAVADAGATTTDTIAALRMHAVNASSAAASALAADSRVVRVEPDRSRATEAEPSDPSYGSQWALPKIGWDQVSGNVVSGSATVAVLDTGVDGSQPDLAGQLVGGASFVGGSATTDPNGHGTAMAGIVAASTDNGIGIAGVGFDGVSIMPVSVLGADGTGRDSDVIEGLVWAADHGADVGLMAFSAPSYSSALQAAVDYAWSKGMVLVAATGNDGSSSAAFPAGDRSVIGVSNTDSSDALNASSNYGASVFLAAPGTGIVTLDVGDGTTTITGTSASAAHVAAAAALLRASDGSLSNGVIVGRLARTADAAGTSAETGNGRLNLARALGDSSADAVQPAGAAPAGSGGPFVGPYVAAGTGVVRVTVLDASTNAPISGAVVTCTAVCNGSGNTGTTDASGIAQFTVNYPGNSNTVTLEATASTYNANAATVLVANTNDAGDPAMLTILLTKTNVAPAVTAPANQSANEGASTSFALGSFSDAGPSPWSVDINWGDGSPHTTFSQAASGTITAQSHTYVDGPATHTVTVTVTDSNGSGLAGSATFQVTVDNVAPTVTFTSGDATADESGVTSHTYTFTVSDPGTDDI